MFKKFNSLREYLSNRIHIPEELLASKEFKVVHISDTPSQIYRSITAMVERLKPQVIIHTGDVADDVKLELHPGEIRRYSGLVRAFLGEICQKVQDTYIIPGNHDSIRVLKGINQGIYIVEPGKSIEVEGFTLGLAHKLEDLPREGDFMLYGHNFDLPEVPHNNTVYLNGVSNVNVVLLPSGIIYKLPYPRDTNYFRRYKRYRKLM